MIKRFNDKLNQKRGAVQWINKNIKEPWGVKVGYIEYAIKKWKYLPYTMDVDYWLVYEKEDIAEQT
ncbi:MAG: hypothetical protein A2Y62_10435 [Candidatus Fischerbacteria bacterium RBG_13_37_8]|uniref:Uncharacterized protein n=1 Tax=Candidatus Fischerbacteria bacterium RBG_13_37_8 TaxID=1817863 RepID=A0A1F5V7P4_9BACT|nr:MAG: hypothetical protein A2Y62_10435 [Candidatus Fischerbacteria bacterium RBG_13_37_8]